MTLKCIIIEDEPLATEKLEGFIRKTPSLSLTKTFDNAIDGLQYLQNQSIDIVFLDIQMEELTGIQMLEALTIKPYVIITSAYAEYALKGYELSVFDYLLKPFGYDRFLKAVMKVQDDANTKLSTDTPNSKQIFVKSEYRQECIQVNDILYIEGMKEYLRIFTTEKKVMTKLSFKALLDQLPEHSFLQVHKSWVINTSKINSIERNRISIGEKDIPIGKVHAEKVKQKLGLE